MENKIEINGNFIKELIKIINLYTILLILSISSFGLIFLPEEFLKKIYVYNFKETYKEQIGMIFFISVITLIILVLIKIYKKVERKIINKKIGKIIKNQLNSMKNQTEIEIIKLLLKEDDFTADLPIYSGVVLKLEQSFIIGRMNGTHCVDMDNPAIPYYLQPGVIEEIEKDEELRKKFNYINE